MSRPEAITADAVMDTLLRKYFWSVDLAGIALVALFSAQATAGAIDSALLRHMPPPQRSPRSSAPIPTASEKDIQGIVRRNIFCSTCLTPVAAAEEPAPPGGPQKTSLPLKLMAIMYAPTPKGPRWSVAVIRDASGGFAGPYSIGDQVRGATVVDIQQTRVYLDLAGRSEFLDLMESSPAAASPPIEPVVAGLPPGSGAPPAPPARADPELRAAMASAPALFSVRGDRKQHRH